MEVKQIGMVGVGSMGGGMSLLFAEHGVDVNFFDPSEEDIKKLINNAKHLNLQDHLKKQTDHKALAQSLTAPRVFVFSTPHGKVADDTIHGLLPHLNKGDIIVDAANEHWRETERRQKFLEPQGIHYIGMGVSGGYQSARHGPSMSPGGSKEALDQLMPWFKTIAAKDEQGRPCVVEVGPGGSGHYVKMVHNGIEQGMMSCLCEAFVFMNTVLGLEYREIGDIFADWNTNGRLKNDFLIGIGAEICHTKDPKDSKYVLGKVKDKVTQDVDDSEGTGVWTGLAAIEEHVSIPTITAAHLFRAASAHAERRESVAKAFEKEEGGRHEQQKLKLEDKEKPEYIRALHDTIVASFFLSYIQGLHMIAKTSNESKWGINFQSLLQLWRGGCIIQSDSIIDVFDKVYRDKVDEENLLSHPLIVKELSNTRQGLKKIVSKAIDVDASIPALAASLEYIKYMSITDLPTRFMEAELDFFGNHMFDLRSDPAGQPEKGKHHYEWKPAKGIHGT